VVVHNFNRIRAPGGPGKANAVSVIDPDAVLPVPISNQSLQTIPHRNAQVIKRANGVELLKFSRRDPPYGLWTDSSGRFGIPAVENVLRSCILE
jgi:hypothetical protein